LSPGHPGRPLPRPARRRRPRALARPRRGGDEQTALRRHPNRACPSRRVASRRRRAVAAKRRAGRPDRQGHTARWPGIGQAARVV